MIENLTDGTKVFIHKRSFWSHALESNQSICMMRKIEAILGKSKKKKSQIVNNLFNGNPSLLLI